MSTRTAVVMFNLGGPDGLEAVEPFLFNLFNDPAIIAAPGPVRWVLARWIAKRRAPIAREIYRQLGGRSPLLEQTEAQAAALEGTLRERGYEARVFVCMRYWHPMSRAVVHAVAAYAPDSVVLLPLYPQFSTATSESSLRDWRRVWAGRPVGATEHAVCCYPTHPGLVAAHARLIRAALAEADGAGRPRVLFSAHGLPKRVVARGDPYQWQVERSAEAIVRALAVRDLDHVICYQSRVGPLEWIGPSTEAELERAGREGVPVVVVPIAFVSEHSETLVELDIEYADKARAFGVPLYRRVPTLGTAPEFIDGLGDLVEESLRSGAGTSPAGGRNPCPASLVQCPCRERD